MAREYPTSFGRKYADAPSVTSPRQLNTKSILAASYANRIAAESIILIPNPIANPLMATMVGLRQLWIATVNKVAAKLGPADTTKDHSTLSPISGSYHSPPYRRRYDAV
jgi:hypothetical protein